MTSKLPIDIGYIANALVQIKRHLHDASVSPHGHEQEKALLMAGKTGCAALKQLSADEQVWSRLRDLHQELQRWQQLQVPIVASLLQALGHDEKSAESVIDSANELLQEAAGFPMQRREDPIAEAQDLVDELCVLMCNMAASAQRNYMWMTIGRGTLKILGGVLLGVIAAEADAGLHQVAPDALHLVEEFGESVRQILPSLSMGVLVAGTRLARQELTNISQRDDTSQRPQASEAYAAQEAHEAFAEQPREADPREVVVEIKDAGVDSMGATPTQQEQEPRGIRDSQ